MASILADLVVNLIGNDASLLAAAKRSASALEDTAAAAAGAGTVMSKSYLGAAAAAAGMSKTAVGTADTLVKMGKYSTIALAGIATYSVDAASKFQAAMELVHTQAGLSQSDVDSLSKSVLALAPAVGIGPDKLAEGLYHVASAFGSQGMPLNEMMDILTMAAHNAATGMADMEDSTQAMIGVMAAGLPDVKNAADAAAYLNTTVGIGDMRMQQLSAAIATGVLPTFKEAGLGMTDFSAAVATLTDNVTPANQAATRLRMTIALLGAPSKAAFEALQAVGIGAEEANNAFSHRDELQKYGVNVSQLSADLQKPDGLLVAVNDLKGHLQSAGLTANEQAAVIEKAFGGGRTSAAIQTLLDESDRLASKYKALGSEASRASQQQQDWAATQQTFRQQTHELGASLQTMGIELGTKLLPPLTSFVNFLATHQGVMKAFFGTLLIFLGLLTLAWIAEGVAMIAANWEIMLILAAIIALAYGIYELVTHWKTVWNFIKNIAMDVWHWLVNVWHDTWRDIMSVVNWIKSNIIDPIVNFFKGMAHGIMDALRFLGQIPGFIKSEVIDPIGRVLAEIGHIFMVAFHAVEIAVKWFYENVLKPIGSFVWNFLLIPFRLVLDLLVFAFKLAWGFMSVVLQDFYNGVVLPVAHAIVEAWNWLVNFVKTYIDLWVAALKAFGDWFMNTFWTNGLLVIWHAIVDAFNWVVNTIKGYIDYWMNIFQGLYNTLVGIWHNIYNSFIGPLVAAIRDMVYNGIQGAVNALEGILHGLESVWSSVWNALKSAASAVWGVVKGIFDGIMGAIHSVENAFHSLESTLNSFNPGKIGGDIAHFLGFAEGGLVPGAKGQARLAVVHGGEYVLTTDQVDAIQGASVTSMMSPSAGAVATVSGGGGGGPSQIIVNVDGKKLFDIMVQRSQRNKIRNNSTFLT